MHHEEARTTAHRTRRSSGTRRLSSVRLARNPKGSVRAAMGATQPVTVDLYLGDCLSALRDLPTSSVDCAVTSPPYWWIRDYGNGLWTGGKKGCTHRPPQKKGRISVFGETCPLCGATRLTHPLGMEPTIDEFVENLCLVFDEVHRVLKDDGSVWVNLGDTYSSKDKGADGKQLPTGTLLQIPARFALAMQKRGWVLRNDIIWHKPNPRPDGVKSRFKMNYEHFYFFTKRSSGYYHDRVEVPGKTQDWAHETSIWVEHSVKNSCGHDSAYPKGLVERPILASCRLGGTVLDPFLGTGTTGLVAAYHGRNFIGIELDRDYFNRTCNRFTDEGLNHQAHVPAVTTPVVISKSSALAPAATTAPTKAIRPRRNANRPTPTAQLQLPLGPGGATASPHRRKKAARPGSATVPSRSRVPSNCKVSCPPVGGSARRPKDPRRTQPTRPTPATKPRFIDLFAGIGGFHLAFHRAGAECVFASEWDVYARKTYERNMRDLGPGMFANEMFVGDITKVDPKSIPDFDILAGGFPCTAFSQAGKKLGFQDPRGTLFFNVMEILDARQPEAFFLENVQGLLTHDEGRTFEAIRRSVEEGGYRMFHQVVRASDYGLPTRRPRLYMVGFRDHSIDFQFPQPRPLRYTMSDVLGGRCPREIGLTLRVGGGGCGLADRRNWDTYLVDGREHRLTVAEAKKMMGFPDDFEFPVSKTQAMKQLGNSVAVDAVEAVATEVLKHVPGPSVATTCSGKRPRGRRLSCARIAKRPAYLGASRKPTFGSAFFVWRSPTQCRRDRAQRCS